MWWKRQDGLALTSPETNKEHDGTMTVMLFSFTHERPHYMRMADFRVAKRRRFVKAKWRNLCNVYSLGTADLTNITSGMADAVSCFFGRGLI